MHSKKQNMASTLSSSLGKNEKRNHPYTQTSLQSVQTHLRHISSLSSTQHAVFTFLAQPLVFLLFFFLGISIPRNAKYKAQAADILDGETSRWVIGQVLGLLMFAVGITLTTLRGCIWLGAKVVHAFCEVNLEEAAERPSSMNGVEGEFELTAANLIVGGFLG